MLAPALRREEQIASRSARVLVGTGGTATILARMEEQGILLNIPYFSEMSVKLEGQISDLEQTIYGYADDEFNIASPAQLATVLFEKLGLQALGKKGKNGDKELLFHVC